MTEGSSIFPFVKVCIHAMVTKANRIARQTLVISKQCYRFDFMYVSNKILQLPVLATVKIECTETLLPNRTKETSNQQKVIAGKKTFTVTSDVCISHSALMWKTEILPQLANNIKYKNTIVLKHQSMPS